MTKTLFFLCVLAVCLLLAGMPALKCSRCEKFCLQKKGRSHVGSSEYLRTFIKTEKGLTEEELSDKSTVICNACRIYIFKIVQRPEHVKAGSKRSLPESEAAAEAASNIKRARDAAAKKLRNDEQFHSVSVDVPGKYLFHFYFPQSVYPG